MKNISDKLPTTYRSHLDHVPDHIRTTLPTTTLPTTYRPRYRPHTDHVTDHIRTTYRPRYRPPRYRPRYRPHSDHIPTTCATCSLLPFSWLQRDRVLEGELDGVSKLGHCSLPNDYPPRLHIFASDSTADELWSVYTNVYRKMRILIRGDVKSIRVMCTKSLIKAAT